MVITYKDGTVENIPDSLLDCQAIHVLNPSLWPYQHKPDYLGNYALLADYIATYTAICEGVKQNVGKLKLCEFYEIKGKLDAGDYSDYANGTCFEMVLEVAQLTADFNSFFDNYKEALEQDLFSPIVNSNWHLKYGDFNTLMSLADGDCTKFTAILELDAATCFTTLAYKAEQAKQIRKIQAQ